MCGIFGIITNPHSGFSAHTLKSAVDKLFKLSESRGKEAAGIAMLRAETLQVFKEPRSATHLMKTREYKNLFLFNLNSSIAIIGHSRLVTDGHEAVHGNNQPVVKSGTVCIHNGIIVNHKKIWEQYPAISREFEVDTEVIPALSAHFRTQHLGGAESIQKVFAHIEGATSIAMMFNNLNNVALATNNGSLYYCVNKVRNCLIFSSERYILAELCVQSKVESITGKLAISHLKPGVGMWVDMNAISPQLFSLKVGTLTPPDNFQDQREITFQHSHIDAINKRTTDLYQPGQFEVILKTASDAVGLLRRCSRCILPETFPFIEYDSAGVCNYCANYRKVEYRGADALRKITDMRRKTNGDPDCILAFSGGRDSSYAVHYVKTVLKMNPLTYTYDWGMITDLARRNISRICGQLGIEHILLSADIRKKRNNIRQNVNAWLERPSLGTVPLFMAGDKQFFYYANKLQKQMDIELLIFSMSPLERTDFKVGFCGINENKHKEKHYNLSNANKLKMIGYYGKEFLLNPSYLNSSVLDTLFGYFSYYMIPQDYISFNDFIPWNEDEINETLIKEYNWELAPDTNSTWRIGDGTAAFYNYIYYIVAGFTENDTFRSNQVREGQITREQALTLSLRDNQPRFQSIEWYCNTIGINFNDVMRHINSIPRLYERKIKKPL